MTKHARQVKILEIIKEKEVGTQEELVAYLDEMGIKATQATISRDIKEMHLVKISVGGDKYKYASTYNDTPGDLNSAMRKMFHDFVVNIDSASHFIVLKTLPGTANALAASLDSADISEIMGTIAGDDTIMIIIKEEDRVGGLFNKFIELME